MKVPLHTLLNLFRNLEKKQFNCKISYLIPWVFEIRQIQCNSNVNCIFILFNLNDYKTSRPLHWEWWFNQPWQISRFYTEAIEWIIEIIDQFMIQIALSGSSEKSSVVLRCLGCKIIWKWSDYLDGYSFTGVDLVP